MCSNCVTLPNPDADAFAERMLGLLNQSAVGMMISVGHRTGLFDAMADLPPSSSADIAGAAGLDERYVREWLGAMVTGRVVAFDPEAGTYHPRPSINTYYVARAA